MPSFCADHHLQGNGPFEVAPGKRVQDELRGMLKEQQEQVNQLSQNLLRWQNPPRRPQFDRNAPLLFRRCQQPGHFDRNCNQQRVRQASQPCALLSGPSSQPPEN